MFIFINLLIIKKFMITINIKLFGIFQDYLSDNICISILPGTSILSLKSELVVKFAASSFVNFEYIMNKSVFSDETNILSDTYILKNNDTIYLLPPFSGG